MKKRRTIAKKLKDISLATTTTPIARAGQVSSARRPSGAGLAEKRASSVEQEVNCRLAKWLADVFGTEDKALQDRLLSQAAGAVSDFSGRELTTFDYIAAAMHGMAPRDSLEGMLSTQIVAGHTLAMTLLERAALPNQADLVVEVNVNRAVKLMRVTVELIAALGRYRGKGEQKMTVEHVHVHQGGQAIVGPVTANLADNNGK